MYKLRNKKAFTIIELIVVIAVLGILVLLGMPKLVGYTTKAQLVRIQHDTKVMQDKMEATLSDQNVEFREWDNNEKDLGTLIMKKQLYEIEGVVTKIDKSHIRFPKYNWGSVGGEFYANIAGYEDIYGEEIVNFTDNINSELGMGGTLLTENEDGFGYKVIPEKYKSDIKTRLKGTFYSNAQGKVYYEPNKPLTGVKSEIAPNCLAPEMLDYIFEHSTGTITKYTGTSQYIVIPESFLVEGKCWPVRIIGVGAFARNMPPIRGVIIPQGVNKIEKDAFEGNEIEAIVIPSGVKNIGDNAFGNNSIGSGGLLIKGPEGSVNIGAGAFDSGVNPVYAPVTGKEAGLAIKPNRDSRGDVITSVGSDGKTRPTGSISSAGWGGSRGSSGSGSNGGSGGSSGSGSNGGSVASGKTIVIPDVIVVDNVEIEITGVEQGAFQGEGLIHVTLPSGLERIEDYAFAGNQLIGVSIPEKVNHVGNYAFGYNELYDGNEYKWTIDYIDFKLEEQIAKVNKRIGNIEKEDGTKVSVLKEANLLDHVWISSAFDFVIPTDYNPITKVLRKEIPGSPQITNITKNSVVVNGGEGTEVKVGNGEWHNSPHTFEGLEINANYKAYSRYKETKDHYVSEASEGVNFTTLKNAKLEVPKVPQINNITGNSAIVIGGEGIEVRIGNGEWYNSPHNFINLNEGSSYIVYSRYKETDSHYAGEPNIGTNFNTAIMPTQPDNIVYNGAVQTFVAPTTGTYLLEVWGAEGGTTMQGVGGKGGYAHGRKNLTKGQVIYLYVGGKGTQGHNASGGWNGGGSSSGGNGPNVASGGGATDIRTNAGSWNSPAGLSSRIIVAGGGGGGAHYNSPTRGGFGGGTSGGNGQVNSLYNWSTFGYGGTQTSGGISPSGVSGGFGYGGGHNTGGGGGGYYGGGSGQHLSSGGGGSGYTGGVQNGQMLAGNQSMPNPNGGTMTGNAGDGKVRITYIGK